MDLTATASRCLTDLLGRCLVEQQQLQGGKGRSRVHRMRLARLADQLYARYRRLGEMRAEEKAAILAEYRVLWGSGSPVLEWLLLRDSWRRAAVQRDTARATWH